MIAKPEIRRFVGKFLVAFQRMGIYFKGTEQDA